MRLLLVILVLLELFLALLVISPIFVDSHVLARDVYNYQQERTKENKKKIEIQQALTARSRLNGRLVIVSLFGANTCGLFVAYRRFTLERTVT